MSEEIDEIEYTDEEGVTHVHMTFDEYAEYLHENGIMDIDEFYHLDAGGFFDDYEFEEYQSDIDFDDLLSSNDESEYDDSDIPS